MENAPANPEEALGPVQAGLIRVQMARICASSVLANAGRLRRFLTFVVDAALKGEAGKLKESVIGVEVYGRDPAYNPKIEPIVRTEARRLRAKLEQYYASAGSKDRVIITLPTGGYAPQFAFRAPEPDPIVIPIDQGQPSSFSPAEDSRTPKIIRLAIVAAAGLILLLFGLYRIRKPPVSEGFRAIAVLPLQNLSHDPDQEYFVDGMTDQLITALAQTTSLRVISHTSVMQYKGIQKPLPEIARALNVDAIVEGSVLPSEGRVRITAQLLDARHDRHIWAQSYERNRSDALAIQDEVTREISRQISAKLEPEGKTPRDRNRAVNPEAYDNYLRGGFFGTSAHRRA